RVVLARHDMHLPKEGGAHQTRDGSPSAKLAYANTALSRLILSICTVSAELHEARNAAAKTDTIMPARIRVRSSENNRTNSGPLDWGDGGGMNPATSQKPIKKMTSIHRPLYTHHRWALVLIVVSLHADGDVRSEKLLGADRAPLGFHRGELSNSIVW
ncbi:hypothetical protein ACJH6J_29605, partial [Mycobacterium sp. SMC-18]|uniref:hypothetical protein n=1 Tax=Mycobacterium sp. SMC-18 TaxID=3381629 RepID=UPI003876CF7E